MKFVATSRQQQGTSASRRLRREAKVPGIVYGNNAPATGIVLDHNELYYALQKEKFHSSILTMELDGVEQLVVLRAFQMHPWKNQVLHCDFQRIDPNANVTMRVPLHFHGEEESPAVKVSKAMISHAASYVEVTCLPKLLPEFISVDLSAMEVGTTFHASNLQLPEGVAVHSKSGGDQVLASVVAAVEEEIPAAEGEAAPAEAAPAEAAN